MISLCGESLKLATKKENFSEWVRAMLFAESEEHFANGLKKVDRKTYECSERGSWIKTTAKRIEGCPHASRFLPASFRDEVCNGFMEVVNDVENA